MPVGGVNMTVYLCGPMAGQPNYGRDSFNFAEKTLRSKGWKVINPACLPTDLKQESYMPICLAMLREADAVVTLHGWKKSDGACLEVRYADHLSIPVFPLQEAFRSGIEGENYGE